MTGRIYPLSGRLNDVLRTLKQLSGEDGSINWAELKIPSDVRADHVYRALVAKECSWAGQCDARAVRALLHYLFNQSRSVREVSAERWTIDLARAVSSNAWFLEPALPVKCNRLLGALRASGKAESGEELRVDIVGNMHVGLVNALIDQGEYWAEEYRFPRTKADNMIWQAFAQLVQRRFVRTAPAPAQGGVVLMVKRLGQF